MLLVPALPAQPVPIDSGFDYVTVDAARRRVYAAHTGSRALLVVDAETGRVIGQVKVGPLHGVAVDPATGHVFTGDGEANTVSEIDPEKLSVLRSADVPGKVDAIAYDAGNGRIYADEDDGTHVFVIDAKTMKSVGSVDLPGHKPEYLAIDPATHEIYQNISDLGQYVVIDPQTLKVSKVVPTPDVKRNHPLQYDAAYGHVIVGGQNGVLAVYDKNGTLVGKTAIQDRVDQCSLDQSTHRIACAGTSTVTVLLDNPASAPTVLARGPVAAEAHTLAIDAKNGNVWVVWPEPTGDFVRAYTVQP